MFALIVIVLIIVQSYVIVYMAWDKDYGCLTRAAFNLLYPILKGLGYRFIAGDVDKFKQLNTKYGHEEVNRMVWRSVRSFFQCCRMGDLVFRLYSGDEFIVATKAKDLLSMCDRMEGAFAAQGMSITLVIVTKDLDTSMLKIIEKKG